MNSWACSRSEGLVAGRGCELARAMGAVASEVLGHYRNHPNLVGEEIARPSPLVLADPDELQRVFVNPACNALEAFDGQPGTLWPASRPGNDNSSSRCATTTSASPPRCFP